MHKKSYLQFFILISISISCFPHSFNFAFSYRKLFTPAIYSPSGITAMSCLSGAIITFVFAVFIFMPLFISTCPGKQSAKKMNIKLGGENKNSVSYYYIQQSRQFKFRLTDNTHFYDSNFDFKDITRGLYKMYSK